MFDFILKGNGYIYNINLEKEVVCTSCNGEGKKKADKKEQCKFQKFISNNHILLLLLLLLLLIILILITNNI